MCPKTPGIHFSSHESCNAGFYLVFNQDCELVSQLPKFFLHTPECYSSFESIREASQAEPNTVADLLDEIEDEKLYQALLAVDKHTLLILLLKMQGYSKY